MQILNRIIDTNHPALIIAEIGINHGGSLEVAKQMVDAAHRAGIEVVKHQTHIVEDEMSKEAKKVIPGNSNDSIYDIMARCALNEVDELELKKYVESKGMIFISTPFSRAAALRLESFGVSAYKIGSGEMNNYPLLKLIASFHKPTIISTGMNDIASIKKAVKIFKDENTPIALLHTTNLYPTPPQLVRLGAMQEMMREFPDLEIGLSDHTLNNNSSIAAIALGATIIERHFTDHKNRVGEDIVCSMDENEARELVNAAKELHQMKGGKKEAAKEEKVTIDFAFATCVSIKPIKKGEVFSVDNLWVKRPGTGEILAEYYESLLGKKAKCDIENDTHITWDMINE
ncbi:MULTISPECIES: N-acetylneuraminate synthase family protein [unclassified Campylobacter]|uniref:N-acetylneuraminate synthase family protein n=1 Tax=unclassified Campylobacter TaxID=2593542 RepID=UPI001DBC61F4|nr:N-acetylneuraminate synthase family protein [Campylobacter sp. RM12651]MBZ7984102.1 N-acetylneuraminate synthase family protein [Campylobacter sp. RM12647]MBZ7993398.1 N-acetylneuraminate synthase family protein [Campylobacter sp. RM9333]ULO02567.1 sialic acid synthase (N-acetylneuraminic acid synthetase) [Campylobacter sp. RM12651]